MQGVPRRKVLQLGGAALTTSLAGCTSFFEQSSTSLSQVEIFNQRPEQHTAHLLIERNDEIVYWSSFELKQAANQQTDITKVDSRVIKDEWPEGSATFAIHVRLDAQTSWSSLTLDEQDKGCHEVLAVIDRTDEPRVSFFSSNDC
ncbi:hypothetical protein [Haloferax sp. Atlit-6N]|uniref:hypothetical protein n=1 Tax=Haloferax sp. Atlit-6N TaxID=2077205 RepID=UPI0011C01983|nr:hypothetical protein [Haloferax sp. Atlit-6N]